MSSMVKSRCFIVQSSQIEERLDPSFYKPEYYEILKNEERWLRAKDVSRHIQHPPEYQRIYSDAGTQLIRSQNVRPTGLSLEESPVYFSKEFLKDKKNIYPEVGDVLIVRSGVNAGDVCVIEEATDKAIIGADNLLLKPKSNVVPKFLQVYFFTDLGRRLLNRFLTGATNKHISPYYMAKVHIPDVSLEIQSNCISIFEDAYKQKIEKEKLAQELLDDIDQFLLDELEIKMPQVNSSLKNRIFNRPLSELSGQRLDSYYYQSHFEEFFDSLTKSKFPIQKVRDISVKISSGITPKSGGDAYINPDIGIPFIRSGDINIDGRVNYDDLLYIRPDIHYKLMKSSKLKQNDILIAIVGATIGQVGIYRDNGEANINQAIAMVRLKSGIDPDYVKELIKSSIGQMILNRLKRPVARANINLEEISSMPIVIPPKEKQLNIVEKISLIRKQAFEIEQQGLKELEYAKLAIEKLILGRE